MNRKSNRVTKCFTFIFAIFLAALVANAALTPQQVKLIDAAIPKKATVKPKQPRKVLIWNTPFMDKCPHKGYSVPQAAYAMKTMGKKTGAYQAVVSDDVAMYLPENLKQFDVIIMNNSNGEWIRPTEADLPKFKKHGSDIDELEKLLKKSLLNWVSKGGGIVAYHHAIGGNNKWPEFKQLLGAEYWGHPWNEEVGVKLDELDHPLLKTFKGKGFRIAEEIFQYREPWSRKTNRVLLSLDTNSTNMTVKWIHRTDNDFGLAWVRAHGKGRVFYGAFGHRTEIWYNPLILQFYLDGIQFAAGDLAADTTPSAVLQNKPNFSG
jgi:type 1 glutamine amidotransferase